MGECAEGAAAAGFLCRSLGRIVACLDGLDAAEQRWAPPAPGTNSVLAIATHALANAEENVLGLLGGEVIERERSTELATDGRLGADDLRARWAGLQPRLTAVLERQSSADLAGVFEHPRRGRWRGFEVLMVALRHAAEHQGQAELTRDLVRARREA
jgi:hypothetical protein